MPSPIPPSPLLLALGPLDPAVATGAALLLLVALALVAWQLRRMHLERLAAAEAARRAAHRPDPSAREGGAGRRAPAQLLSAADKAARRGDHDRAVRLLWEGLVTALDRGQVLAPRPDGDPRTVLIAFKGSAHGRELLETVVGQVEAVCLRGEPADGHRYQLVREAADQVAASEGAFLS